MMIETINLILNKMTTICKKTQRKFIIELLSTILSLQGKVNFRNMSRYSVLNEKTFSRNFRKGFNFPEFNQQAVATITNEQTRLIAAFDPSFVSKAGKKTYGKGYFWNGSASKAEKGLEIGVLGVVDVDRNIAYGISAQQTPASPKKEDEKTKTENSRIDIYLDHIEEHKKYLPEQVEILVADSFFSKEKFVTGIINFGLHMVGKLRIDARLRFLHEGKQSGSGRPKKYGDFVNVNEFEKLELVQNIKSEEGKDLKLCTAIVNVVAFKRNVRIAVIIDPTETEADKKAKAIFFSTDINQKAFDILTYYRARYQLEFVIRDGKGFAGLGDCQARSQEKLNLHFNASLAATNIAKIMDYFNQQKNTDQQTNEPGPESTNTNQEKTNKDQNTQRRPFSMGSWRRKFHNERFIDSIFSMFGINQTLIKSHPKFNDALNYGVISRV